jgi:hypothetical protein
LGEVEEGGAAEGGAAAALARALEEEALAAGLDEGLGAFFELATKAVAELVDPDRDRPFYG